MHTIRLVRSNAFGEDKPTTMSPLRYSVGKRSTLGSAFLPFSPFLPFFRAGKVEGAVQAGCPNRARWKSRKVGRVAPAVGTHDENQTKKLIAGYTAAHLVELGQLVDVGEGEVGVLQVVEAPVGRAGEDRGPPIRHRVVPVPSQAAEQLVRPGNCRQGWKHLRLAICRREME